MQWTWLLNPPIWTMKNFLFLQVTQRFSSSFLRKAYCERLRLVMTRNIGKVGLLFKAYYVDAVKRTANGVAENHSAVSANHHSAGSAIPEKNGDRGGLVITLSWLFPRLYSSQCWYTNKTMSYSLLFLYLLFHLCVQCCGSELVSMRIGIQGAKTMRIWILFRLCYHKKVYF